LIQTELSKDRGIKVFNTTKELSFLLNNGVDPKPWKLFQLFHPANRVLLVKHDLKLEIRSKLSSNSGYFEGNGGTFIMSIQQGFTVNILCKWHQT